MDVRPLTPERLDDLARLFGTSGVSTGCWCMWFLLTSREFDTGWGASNRVRFEEYAKRASVPPGLLAYRTPGEAAALSSAALSSAALSSAALSSAALSSAALSFAALSSAAPGVAGTPGEAAAQHGDGEPIGWCATGPRSRYGRALRSPLLRGRDPAEDDAVWLVACLFVRRDARRAGVTADLIEAAVRLAHEHGAHAVEAMPLAGGRRHPTAEAYVGTEAMFAGSGFEVRDRPSPRRLIMRRELTG